MKMDLIARTAGLVLAVIAAPVHGEPRYRLTSLAPMSVPPATSYAAPGNAFGVAVNASGQVAGSGLAGNGRRHAFLWTGSSMQDLGTLGGSEIRVSAINASGHVVGVSQLPGDTVSRAFLWDGATLRDLGAFNGGNSAALAINSAGHVVGWADSPSIPHLPRPFLWDRLAMRDLWPASVPEVPAQAIAISTGGRILINLQVDFGYAFVWRNGVLTNLGNLGSTGVAARALNDAGEVTGVAATTSNDGEPDHYHAFRWSGGFMSDLGVLGGNTSQSIAINNLGYIVGTSDSNVSSHAFLWDTWALRDLGTLGGLRSHARALNRAGQVIGASSKVLGSDEMHAFLWNGTTLVELATLVDAADPLRPHVTLREGFAINDLGHIVADGCDRRTNTCNAYLLTPIDSSPPVVMVSATGLSSASGWFRGNVSVTFAVSDAEAPVSSANDCETAHVTTDTSGVTFTCTATSIGGTAAQSITVRRDATQPSLTLVSPGAGAVYARGQTVKAKYSCADATSGIATCAGPVADGGNINTSRPVSNASFTVTAIDAAGNSRVVTRTYSVR